MGGLRERLQGRGYQIATNARDQYRKGGLGTNSSHHRISPKKIRATGLVFLWGPLEGTKRVGKILDHSANAGK